MKLHFLPFGTSTTLRSKTLPHGPVWAASLMAVVLFTGCGWGPLGQGANRIPEESLAQGGAVYQANCAVCHGSSGAGQPDWHIRKADGILPPPPLNGDGHTWHHGDGTLYTYVSQGGAAFESPSVPGYKSGMPAFGDTLSHDEIVSVISYVKSLWGDKQFRGAVKRESQELVSERDPFPEVAP